MSGRSCPAAGQTPSPVVHRAETYTRTLTCLGSGRRPPSFVEDVQPTGASGATDSDDKVFSHVNSHLDSPSIPTRFPPLGELRLGR